jgi:hypothetical protein
MLRHILAAGFIVAGLLAWAAQSSPITSSASANAVLIPLPVVTATTRVFGSGA